MMTIFFLSFEQKIEAAPESFGDENFQEYVRPASKKKEIPVFNEDEIIWQGSRRSDRASYDVERGWSWTRVEKAVIFASQQTGVRKEFLFGMLAVESDLGRNVGGCSYEEVERGAERSHNNGTLSLQAWKTFQHRRNLVREIAEKLSYEYRDLKVSCNPAGYIGTGGALGVGQFMPDTWLEYEDRIAKIVKKDEPDPWDLEDGVVAMALKLSDYPGVVEHNSVAESNAAKVYLSGTISGRYNWYASLVQYWSRNYRRLLA